MAGSRFYRRLFRGISNENLTGHFALEYGAYQSRARGERWLW